MKIELEVQRASARGDIPPDSDFRRWIACIPADRDDRATLTIRIVDEDESRRLNHAYRDRDSATNVLSFEPDLPEQVLQGLRDSDAALPLGDLVICAPAVAAEALEQGKPPAEHWAHLAIHGTLHLLGHDHQDPEAARAMEKLEIEMLAGLGIPDPYTPRPA